MAIQVHVPDGAIIGVLILRRSTLEMIEITKKSLFTTLIFWEGQVSYRRIWQTKKILEHRKKFAKKFFVFIFSFYLRPIVKLQKWVNGKFCSVSEKVLFFLIVVPPTTVNIV